MCFYYIFNFCGTNRLHDGVDSCHSLLLVRALPCSSSDLPGSPGRTGAISPAVGARGVAHPDALKRKLTLLQLIDELSALKDDDGLHGMSPSIDVFALLNCLVKAPMLLKRNEREVSGLLGYID